MLYNFVWILLSSKAFLWFVTKSPLSRVADSRQKRFGPRLARHTVVPRGHADKKKKIGVNAGVDFDEWVYQTLKGSQCIKLLSFSHFSDMIPPPPTLIMACEPCCGVLNRVCLRGIWWTSCWKSIQTSPLHLATSSLVCVFVYFFWRGFYPLAS